MQRKTTLILSFVALTALMVSSITPVSASRSNLLSPEANDEAEAFTDGKYGAGNGPFGQWGKAMETISFYFHHDGSPSGSSMAGYMDYEKGSAAQAYPINGGAGGGSGTATFIIPMGNPAPAGLLINPTPDLTPTTEINIHSISLHWASTCVGANVGDVRANAAMTVAVQTVDPSGSAKNWITPKQATQSSSLTGGSGLPTQSKWTYSYSQDFGDLGAENGKKLAAGHSILVTIEMADRQSVLACDLEFDNGNTGRMILLADSGRVNSWIENSEGKEATALSQPESVSVDRRKFTLQRLHTSAFPGMATYDNPNKGGGAVNYLDGIDGAFKERLRNTGNSDIIWTGGDIEGLRTVSVDTTSEGDHISKTTRLFQYSPVTGDPSFWDSTFQFEIWGTGYVDPSRAFSIGGRSFTMTTLGSTTHEVNAGERTEFTVLLKNTGADEDTITVRANNPPSGWDVNVVNGKVRLLGGAEAEVVISVTPPAGLNTGAGDIPIRATSSFPNEVASKDVTLKVQLVNAGSAAVVLSGAPAKIEIDAGSDLEIAGLRLFNDAPFADSFVVRGKFPSNVVGWSAGAAPSGATVAADSFKDFVLQLKAPATAPDGLTTTLTVEVTRIGAASPIAALQIPVEVIYEPAIEVRAADWYVDYQEAGRPAASSLQIRDDGSDSCPGGSGLTGCTTTPYTDARFANDATMRVELTNPTNVQETYKVTGAWNPVVGSVQGVNGKNVGSCDGTGKPDGWRNEMAEEGNAAIDNSPATAGGYSEMVTIPAQTTVYRYVILGHIDVSCGDSNTGIWRVTAQSQTDLSVSASYELGVHRTAAGAQTTKDVEFANSKHAVAIQPDLMADGSGLHSTTQTSVDTSGSTTSHSYQAARHVFRIANLGNEIEDLLVEIPNAPTGFTQELAFANPVGRTIPAANQDCIATDSSNRKFKCPLMGPGDEAVMELVVTPASTTKIGRVLDTIITVRSGDDGSITDTLPVTTRTVGEYDFDASVLKPVKTGAAGKTVSLPFTVSNTGSEGDNFETVLTAGKADWKPRFSTDQRFHLPGQGEQTGFLLVTIPTGTAQTAAGATGQIFRIQVSSDGGTNVKVLDFEVRVGAAGAISVTGLTQPATGPKVATDSVVLQQRGGPNTFDVRAVGSSAQAGQSVTFSYDTTTIPSGWSVVVNNPTQTFTSTGTILADTTVTVTPPANALSTSKVPLSVIATAGSVAGNGDVFLSLVDDAQVNVELESKQPGHILAGGQLTYKVRVSNEALTADEIELSATQLPAGWSVSFSRPSVPLGAREDTTVDAIVAAPTGAAAQLNMTFNLFAISKNDNAVFASIPVSTIVGYNAFDIETGDTTVSMAPGDTAQFVVRVGNDGTLPDEISITSMIATSSLADSGTITTDVQSFPLALDQAKDVTVRFALADAPASVDLKFDVVFKSLRDVQIPAAEEKVTFTVKVFDYVSKDVDGDGALEFAIDRDGKVGNGYEAVAESLKPSGKDIIKADLQRFLSPQARASKTVDVAGPNGTTTQAFVYNIDGDGDGKRDHFLDDTGNGLPNVYWDPDRTIAGSSHAMRLTVFKDVNGDGLSDYFVDVDGDKKIDKVFDVAQGIFIPVLVRDVDGDGTMDYAVDLNSNGIIDSSETVLFTRGGVLIKVLKIDVDGDGKLDDVFDTDGDDRVDSFIRSGETEARAVTLKDVNNDGILDWTYDSNLDGKPDKYYDPWAQTGGHTIDTADTFATMVAKYWFVPVLFLLVGALFVVLIVVTRR